MPRSTPCPRRGNPARGLTLVIASIALLGAAGCSSTDGLGAGVNAVVAGGVCNSTDTRCVFDQGVPAVGACVDGTWVQTQVCQDGFICVEDFNLGGAYSASCQPTPTDVGGGGGADASVADGGAVIDGSADDGSAVGEDAGADGDGGGDVDVLDDALLPDGSGGGDDADAMDATPGDGGGGADDVGGGGADVGGGGSDVSDDDAGGGSTDGGGGDSDAGGGGNDAGGDAGTGGGDDAGSGIACVSPAQCADGDVCTEDKCADGFCENPVLPIGTACNDGDACTEADKCGVNGICAGAPLTCPDMGPCAASACDPNSGCQFSDLPNGSSCDDGNPCTGPDSCLGGLCAPGPSLTCDDNNPCTVDTCDITSGGCVYNPLNQPCDDGKACTTGDICNGGVCEGVVQCDDGNPCTVDSCDVFGQCSSASVGFGQLCDDGDPCTSGDSCEQGACVGQAKDCDDGDPCTADLCDPFGQCQHQSNTGQGCDDGNPCTVDDICNLLGSCQGVEKVCDDGDPCTADACDPGVGCTSSPAVDGSPCDDGDACTENDACQAGVCDAGTPKNCDDGIACSDDTCNAGVCEHTASAQPGCCGKAAGPATLMSETFDLAEAAGWTFSNSKGAGKGWQVWLNPKDPPGPQSAPGVLYYGDPAAGNFAMGGSNNGKATSPALQLPANAPQELTLKIYMNTESSSSYDRLYVRLLSGGQTSTLWQKPSGYTGSWKTLTLDLSAHAGKEVQLVLEFNTIDSVANTGLGVLIDDVVIADKGAGGAPGPGLVLCDDGNPCTDDLCDEQTWTCKATQVADATPCDDGKACTTDASCLAGQCIGTESCDDGNPCTAGGCGADGACAYVPVPDATPCDDGSVCTTDDSCAAGECLGADLPCDDGNDCTTDACDPVAGCVFDATDGAPCDDNDACTSDDTCAVDLCGGVTVICDDDNSCTTDSCDPAVGCSHVPLPDAATCDDGDGCTINDACSAGQCAGGGPKDCDDGFPCSDDSCVAGECQHVASAGPGCCQPGGTLSWGESFDAPLQGWTLNNSKGEGKGWQQLDPTFDSPGAKSGTGTLYYGDPAAKNFDLGGSNNGTAESGTFTLPAAAQGLKATFAVYVHTESGSTYDQLQLRVLEGGGSATVWTRPSGSSFQQKWQDIEVNLEAYAGKTISLQFSFNTVDGVGNSGLGVLIDDLVVGTGVIDGAIACDDGDPCTADACSDAFLCVNESMADGSACDDGQPCTADDSCLFGQCLGNESCDDGNSCTAGGCDFAGSCGFIDLPDGTACDDGNACTAPDVCSQALCGGAEVLCDDGDACTDDACDIAVGCTATATDCSDGNECTADSCDSALGCEHAPVVDGLACDDGDACSLADACTQGMCTGGGQKDCDDQDPCTDDACADGECTHTPNNGPGCCTPDVAVWSFDGQDPSALTFTNSKGTGKGWQVWTNPQTPPGAQSAPGVLYYGDPAAGNFSLGGTNNGKARTVAVQLPPGGNLSLQLKLYMDTEGGTTYDRLFIHKYVDGAKSQVWNKGSGGFSTKKWLDINIDLSGDAGKSVEIEFEFNTVDSVANSGLGVLIDDLKIAGDCGLQP